MKKHLRHYVASAFLLLPAATAMLAVSSAATAQPATPDVGALTVTSDGGLRPGSRLSFRLTGTPHTKASVRIRGLRENVALRESAPGVFVGSYTITRDDRIDRDTELRATLRHGNRQASANFTLADTMVAVVVPPPRIERFGMAPVDRIRPGSVLRFRLDGTPGGTAVVDLPGIRNDFALREVRPGSYEGGYTLRRGDDFNPDRPIVATLRNGERVVTASLNPGGDRPGGGGNAGDNRPRPGGDNQPPSLVVEGPAEGSTVAAGPVHIAASFSDGNGNGGGVVPRSVQVVVSGRNVTRETVITLQSLSYWGNLPPGRHTVDVTARDKAGNETRKTWAFNVVPPR